MTIDPKLVAGMAGALLAGFGGTYLWQKHQEEQQLRGAATGAQAHANPTHDPGMKVQSLLFSRDEWDVRAAKEWAKEHGYRYGSVDEKTNTLRLRQHDPSDFKRGTMRTIEFGSGYGIKAVVAKPKR